MENTQTTQDNTTPDVNALRELDKQATPGPWKRDVCPNAQSQVIARGNEVILWHRGHGRQVDERVVPNAELICAMRNALPALLDAAERFQWRPIEAAPYDKPILVNGTFNSVVGVRSTEEQGKIVYLYGDGEGAWNGPSLPCVSPTHWMPLPAAPASDAGQEVK